MREKTANAGANSCLIPEANHGNASHVEDDPRLDTTGFFFLN